MKNLLKTILTTVAAFALMATQCVAEPGAGTFARTIKVGGLNRTYYLHLPRTQVKDKAVALVLMFHGGGGTPAYAERESKFSEMADREGFLVAYPEGIGKSWNDGRNEQAIVAQRDKIDDLGFVTP